MAIDIRIEKNTGTFDILPDGKITKAKFKIKDILDDIADNIEYQAGIFAPVSDEADKSGGSTSNIDSGTLSENPVYIEESGFGKVANIGREAEGYRSVQAPAGAVDPITGKKIGGKFVKGKATGIGHVFYTTTIKYPDDPFYAKYVAFGSGTRAAEGSFEYGKNKVYTPDHKPIVPLTDKPMEFRYLGKKWKLGYTLGQSPQPYLDEAVNSSYIKTKLGELRIKLNATI